MLGRNTKKLAKAKLNRRLPTFLINYVELGIRPLFILLTLFSLSQSAWADKLDAFNAFVNTSYSHDDNLFRLPNGVNPVNGGPRSDNIFTNSIGVSFNKSYSLQKINLLFTHVDHKYQNADYLDFKANNYSARWGWALTPYLTGSLSADRYQRASGFADFRNVQTQNTVVSKNEIFDLDFSPYGNWHFLTSYGKRTSTNSTTFVQENSFVLNTHTLGVRYVFPSSSFLEINTKNKDGENTDQQEITLSQTGRNFDEKENEVKMSWLLSGKSTVVANLAHLKREYDSTPFRDYSGNFGGAQYSYQATGKLLLNVNFSRSLNSFQRLETNYSQIDSISFSPNYSITSKLSLVGNVGFSERDFKGNGPLPTNDKRLDKIRLYSLMLQWAPTDSLSFGASVKREDRNSTDNFFDYTSNSVNVNGGWTF